MSAVAAVSDGQLAALLAGANPAPDVPLPRLARESKETAPSVHGDAVAVLASPTRLLAFTINARGALGFHPAYVAAREGRFAALVHAADGWRLTAHDAAAKAIDGIGLPDGGGGAGGEIALDLAGFGALVASADVLHEAQLHAELDRRHLPPPEFGARALERTLAHGLSTGDTRWAVCAARWTAPVSLAGARGKMKEGLKALEGPGMDVARSLAGVRSGMGVTALAWEGGRRRALAHGMALAGERSLWWAEWDGVPVAPHARLRGVQGKDVAATASAWLTAGTA